MARGKLRLHISMLLYWTSTALRIAWLLTKNDVPTFVFPNTMFGMTASLSGPVMMDNTTTTPLQLLHRLPWVILFSWTNLFIFNLSNQRLPASVQEDKLNKPWRPIPSGQMTSTQARRIMLLTIPVVLAFNHYVLHVGVECALLFVLNWLYNDLEGGDDHWASRNIILAAAFWLYNVGTSRVAATDLGSPATSLSAAGTVWTSVISLVILTTMQVQDIKDQDGDRLKGRKSVPIVLGDSFTRWTVAIPVIFWSLFCPYYWSMGIFGWMTVSFGLLVAWRCLSLREKSSDEKTWKLWAFWTIFLSSAPFVHSLGL